MIVVGVGRIVVGLLFLIGLAACGNGDQDPVVDGSATTTPAGGATTDPEPSTTTLNTTDTTAGERSSPLRRRDARPGGVAAQAGFFAGGADSGTCDDRFPGPFTKPTISVPSAGIDDMTFAEIAVGTPDEICYFGFHVGPVHLTIDGPEGRVQDETVCFGCTGLSIHSVWRSFPGVGQGVHSVTATQGAVTTGGTFRLVRQTEPVLIVDESPGRDTASVSPGSTVRIGLAGFPAGQDVELDIYRSADTQTFGPYVTSITVLVDAGGEAVHTLTTSPADPLGCYSFHSRPEVDVGTRWDLEEMNGFCLQ